MPRDSAQKDEIRGKFRGSNSAEKTQIPRLGSKFRGPRKTVGPNNYKLSTSMLREVSSAHGTNQWHSKSICNKVNMVIKWESLV